MERPDNSGSDHADLVALYEASYTQCCRLAYSLLGDRRQAEDCVMDALTSFVTASRRHRVDDPGAYLRRIVVNRSKSLLRRRRIERIATARFASLRHSAPAQGDVTNDEASTLEALNGLSPTLKATVALRYIDDRSIDEIARIMSCSPSTVRANLSRARSALRTAGTGDTEATKS